MNKNKARVVVLASGNGSNLQAIIDACKSNQLAAEVVAVISDNLNSYALQRARKFGIQADTHLWAPYKILGLSRNVYDRDLGEGY